LFIHSLCMPFSCLFLSLFTLSICVCGCLSVSDHDNWMGIWKACWHVHFFLLFPSLSSFVLIIPRTVTVNNLIPPNPIYVNLSSYRHWSSPILHTHINRVCNVSIPLKSSLLFFSSLPIIFSSPSHLKLTQLSTLM